MALTLDQYREKYPEVADVGDEALANYLHGKYYSDMPFKDYAEAIGYTPVTPETVANPIIHQAQRGTQFDPSKALFDTSLGVVFGFIIFFILTYGLYGKSRDSASKLGRWWGGIMVLFFICTGGETSEEHWSLAWFEGTFARSIISFLLGYLAGITKWYLFSRKKQEANEPPPFSESYEKHSSYQNTSQEKSEEKSKKEQSFEERLRAVTNNSAICLAMFDLDEHASPSEIKLAFQKKRSGYHPDKVSSLGDRLQKVAEEEMKLLNKAYETLEKLGYC